MKAEEDEQLLELVSNALRDGPGSVAWEQATSMIDAGEGEELAALYRVRQRIESGKRWRQVRPGVGFTRKLMDAVDQQSEANVRSTGPATIIAILCGVLVLVGIAVLVPMLLSHAKVPEPWVQSDFANAVGGDWRVTGNLEVKASHGLRAVGPINGDGGQWGIQSVKSFPADQSFSFAATVDVPNDGTTAQVFVTNQENELGAMIDGQQVRVMLPGAQLAITPRPKNGSVQIRWLIGPSSETLELDGKQIWAGTNDLSGDQPRFIGVRFLVQGPAGSGAAIENVDVRTKN
jgi:hypothetical protein